MAIIIQGSKSGEIVMRWHHVTLVQSVYQFLESLVANSANWAHVFCKEKCDGILFLYVFES